MGYKEMDWVWDNSQASKSDKLVLLAIARRYKLGVGAWPSQEYLAKVCGVHQRSIRNSLLRLEALGELSWNSGSAKSGKANLYFLPILEMEKTSAILEKTSAEMEKTSGENGKNFLPLNNQLDIYKYIYPFRIDFEFDLTPGSVFYQRLNEARKLLNLDVDVIRGLLERFQEHPNFRMTKDKRVQAKRFFETWLVNEVKGAPQKQQGYSIAEGDK